jgi:hypothetical protein
MGSWGLQNSLDLMHGLLKQGYGDESEIDWTHLARTLDVPSKNGGHLKGSQL